MRLAILSDTHGLLRPEILRALAGVDHILHAGDLGTPEVLLALRKVAPVTAILGNVDDPALFPSIHPTEMVRLAGVTFYLVHAIAGLDLRPEDAGIDVVVFGHSHKPSQESRNGVVYLNPGSAGPRRFKLPIAMAFGNILNNGKAAFEIRTFEDV